MMTDPWQFENRAREEGFRVVAGIDEAGRGPLAGPVVAAAVILPKDFSAPQLDDSKKLSHKKRESLYETVYSSAVSIGIAIVDAVEIDRTNILKASLLCMSMAVDNLCPLPDHLLVDGPFGIPMDLAQTPIKGGDGKSISIAAASVVAKVTRDRLMERYDLDFPQYGFARHKGYGTAAHRAAIQTHGHCPIHRKTFRSATQASLFDES